MLLNVQHNVSFVKFCLNKLNLSNSFTARDMQHTLLIMFLIINRITIRGKKTLRDGRILA